MIIKELIKGSGFKQKWIAQQMGVSEITVSNWVKSKYIPSFKNQERLSVVLGIPFFELKKCFKKIK
jgi:transcriptional regulator with XRE-family HTH domain